MYDAEVREKAEVERRIWESRSREAWRGVVGEKKGAPAQKAGWRKAGCPRRLEACYGSGKISDLRDAPEARCL